MTYIYTHIQFKYVGQLDYSAINGPTEQNTVDCLGRQLYVIDECHGHEVQSRTLIGQGGEELADCGQEQIPLSKAERQSSAPKDKSPICVGSDNAR